jgi:hypothetical protein
LDNRGDACREILDNGHDVGSEYALYMVGAAEKIGFLNAVAAAAAKRQVLDASGCIPYTSAVPERIKISPPPRSCTRAARRTSFKDVRPCRGAAN